MPDMETLKTADEQQLAEMRAWFFKENIRINEAIEEINREKEAIALERDRMRRENELFEKKLEILKSELYRLAGEKKEIEDEKLRIKFMKERAKAECAAITTRNSTSLFFRGVGNEVALKKRYRDLLKIYHPDNMNGDTDTIQCINKEFDNLKKRYCG